MDLIKDIANNAALVITMTGAVAIVGKQWIDFLEAFEAYIKNALKKIGHESH